MTMISEDRYIIEPNSGCWLYLGHLDRYGYGQIWWNKKTCTAHRVSWEENFGPVPKGLSVCHKCDVRCCINPDHLFLGTTNDNLKDMVAKGRQNYSGLTHLGAPKGANAGEKSGRAKLTESDIIAIRNDNRPHILIAEQYGIKRNTVSSIKSRTTWGHVTEGNEYISNKKLTDADVIAIRNDERFQDLIAKDYNISQGLVSAIKLRKKWQHVP